MFERKADTGWGQRKSWNGGPAGHKPLVLVATLCLLVAWCMPVGAQNCDPACPTSTPYSCSLNSPGQVKSSLPAVVELDPYTLLIKDQASYWEILTTETAPFGSGWGLDLATTSEGLVVYFLLSPTDSTSPSSIFALNPSTRALTNIMDLGVRASGLAHKEGNFYIAYGDAVSRVGGASVALSGVWGLDYVSDPSGDYLLAIVRSFSPGKVYKIVLVDGEPSGTPVLVQTLNTPTGSPLQAHQFAGTARARILWEDGLERDVLYVTKDDYVTLPCDAVGIIDASSGEILKVVRAKESGIALDASILWPSGVSSNVLNWANPQGIKYHDGRLFIMTRYYWNKGLTQPSCYSYALKAYVNGQEAQGSSGAVIVTEGDQIRLTYEVRNNGFYPVTLTRLTDSSGADLTATCALPKTINAGESYACEVMRSAQSAPEGKAFMAKASVGCLTDQLAPVWYKTVARPTTTTVTASTSAHPAWTRGIAYDWTVTDTVGSASVSLGRGQSASVTTTLAAIRTATSEANRYGASGQVCVTNGGTLATEGLNIVQRLQYRSGAAAFAELAGTRAVITPAEQIAAGESRCFPYQAEFTPVAQATYRSVATITISNYDGHGGEAYGPEASAEFSIPATPSTTANDGQARLSHAVSCPAGFTCTPDDAGPWDLSGSGSFVVTMSIENVSGACDSVAEVASGATLVEGTSAEQRSASAVVSVATGSCPLLSGCTRGHGYWKTHPERVAPLLPVSLGAGGTNGMTVTDSSAAVEILEMKTHGGPSNGITKLYAQLLTAKLNAATGADTSSIAATIQSADAFLATHDYESWARLGASARNEILGWMETLDAYNNGKMGPGVCTEPASPVKATVAAKKPVTQTQATKSVSLPKATGNQQTKKASKKLPTVPLSWLAR